MFKTRECNIQWNKPDSRRQRWNVLCINESFLKKWGYWPLVKVPWGRNQVMNAVHSNHNNIKYLGVTLTKEVKHLCEKNFTTFMKETGENITICKDHRWVGLT